MIFDGPSRLTAGSAKLAIGLRPLGPCGRRMRSRGQKRRSCGSGGAAWMGRRGGLRREVSGPKRSRSIAKLGTLEKVQPAGSWQAADSDCPRITTPRSSSKSSPTKEAVHHKGPLGKGHKEKGIKLGRRDVVSSDWVNNIPEGPHPPLCLTPSSSPSFLLLHHLFFNQGAAHRQQRQRQQPSTGPRHTRYTAHHCAVQSPVPPLVIGHAHDS